MQLDVLLCSVSELAADGKRYDLLIRFKHHIYSTLGMKALFCIFFAH